MRKFVTTKTYYDIPFPAAVTPGLPEIQVPWHESRNVTVTLTQEVKMLGSGMIVIPLVSLLVHVTIAKFFGEYFLHYWIYKCLFPKKK